jgi:signal transduction histidine kinase
VKTFTARSTLRISTLVTATTVVLLVAGGILLHRQLIHSIELMHDVEGEELAGLIGQNPDLTPAQITRRIMDEADSDMALFYIQVHHEEGALIFRSANMGQSILPSELTNRPHWRTSVPGLGSLWVSEYPAGPWRIQIASRLAPVQHVLRDYAQVSAILAVVALILSVGLGYGFSRFLLRPVRAIEQTARRIRGDNLGARIPVPPGNDELASLVLLLNQMFDRLQSAFAQVQRFTADASHELKTPLALMRLNAEKLRPALATDPEGASALDDLLDEISRLHRIIEHLLFLSKAEGGSLALELRPFPVQPWVDDFAQDAQALAEDGGRAFVVTRNDAGELMGEPHLLRQVLLNLMSNALRAAPPGGTVTFSSAREAARWQWVVTDDGPGLPEEQLERIFDRFVRLPASDGSEEAGGHGLGLAICRSIVTLHGGLIRAVNRTDRPGLQLVVELPTPTVERSPAPSVTDPSIFETTASHRN